MGGGGGRGVKQCVESAYQQDIDSGSHTAHLGGGGEGKGSNSVLKVLTSRALTVRVTQLIEGEGGKGGQALC